MAIPARQPMTSQARAFCRKVRFVRYNGSLEGAPENQRSSFANSGLRRPAMMIEDPESSIIPCATAPTASDWRAISNKGRRDAALGMKELLYESLLQDPRRCGCLRVTRACAIAAGSIQIRQSNERRPHVCN